MDFARGVLIPVIFNGSLDVNAGGMWIQREWKFTFLLM